MSQLISTAINHIELFQSSFLCDVKSCKLWVIVEDDDDDSSPILTSFRVFTPDIVCFSFTWYGGAGGAGCQLPSLLLLQSRRAGPCPGTGGDTRSSWRLAWLLSWRSLWRSDTVTVYRPAAIKLRVSPHLGQFIFVIHHVHIQGKTRHTVKTEDTRNPPFSVSLFGPS